MDLNNLTGLIIEYESGELDANGKLSLFASLIKTGLAWQLQGSYGRAARELIECGFIDRDGNILVDAEELEA